MAHSPCTSESTRTFSVGSPLAGLWAVQPPSDSESRLEALTPIEREGARYGYRSAGLPFGPGRKGLEIWLELRARATGKGPHSGGGDQPLE